MCRAESAGGNTADVMCVWGARAKFGGRGRASCPGRAGVRACVRVWYGALKENH